MWLCGVFVGQFHHFHFTRYDALDPVGRIDVYGHSWRGLNRPGPNPWIIGIYPDGRSVVILHNLLALAFRADADWGRFVYPWWPNEPVQRHGGLEWTLC